MTAEQMSRTITRLAHEIIEKNPDAHDLAIVGIHTRGAFLGERLHKLLCEAGGCKYAAGNLDITFYRDDVGRAASTGVAPISIAPVVKGSELPFSVEGATIILSRTLDIAEYEDAAVHICHVSTAASLAAIERARAAGVRVTAEVTPHHLTLNDEAIAALDPNFKMNPPLRAESDRKALVAALKSGLLDCVATDHAPHAAEEKDVPFEEAPFGCIGLETAFSVLYGELVGNKALDLGTLVTRMSTAPARIAGLPAPSVSPGAVANLCVVDPKAKWTVSADGLQSRSFNSPWLGHELTARVKLTLAAGRVAWEDLA